MKVILFMAISLNGIIATEDNKEEFLSNDNWQEFIQVVKNAGCLIWGRKTYELVTKCDESHLSPFENITKIIISHKKSLKLKPGFTLANSPKHALELLKDKGFTKVILTGGAKNNSTFAKLDLIDEIILNVEGVVVGKGISLFKPEDFQLPLRLKTIKQISKNIFQAHYTVEKAE